jgi:hypothetical protein
MRDDLGKSLTAFHKRAKSPQGVFVDVRDWRDARERSRPVRWWSAWTPAELAPFATITMAGSSFFESLTYLATRKVAGDEIEFVRTLVPMQRGIRKPTIRICYFAEQHVGSTEFWSKREGKACLDRIGRHMERRVKRLGFWSGNDVVLDYLAFRMPGLQVQPRIAGSNNYRHLTSCAFIYSAKATPLDRVLMQVFDLTQGDILRARETEDMWQFAMRGAPREGKFGGTYTVYVYDRQQAETLARMVRESDVGHVLDPECVAEAGIADIARPKPGPKPGEKARASGKSFEERQEERRDADRQRKAAQRERKRAAQEAGGTLRPRGRPRKADAAESRP